MARRLCVIALLGFLAACDSQSAGDVGRHPYGVWMTGRGHVVIITKDDKYTYCESRYCTSGSVKFVGSLGVTLVGFMKDPITRGLRVESGAEELRRLRMDKSDDFDFTEMGAGMSPSLRKDLCANKPCVPFGVLEGNAYRFVKSENF